MFVPGDTVVCRHHVCSVVAVREAYFEGRDYLELHALFEKSLKLFVAVDEARLPTLRPVMGRAEALAHRGGEGAEAEVFQEKLRAHIGIGGRIDEQERFFSSHGKGDPGVRGLFP